LEYFEQLTAEKKFTRYHNGFPKQEWKKAAGARNEALDCRVYAYAALYALYASGLRLRAHCDKFAQMANGRRSESKTMMPQHEQRPQPPTESVPPALMERTAPEPWVPRRNWF
jgi:phage terminase large subunit GpA-like protein